MLVVYGNTHYDVIAQYEQLPSPNDRLFPTAITLAPGGMGGNVAAIFARLGGNCRFLGPLSSGEDGVELRQDLERDGVDTTWAANNPGPGARGLIMVDSNAERAIVGYYTPELDLLPRSTGQSPIVLARGSMRPRYAQDPLVLPREAFSGRVDGFYCPMNFAPAALPQIPDSIPVFIDLEGAHLDALTPDQVAHALRRAAVLFINHRSLVRLKAFLNHSGNQFLVTYRELVVVETRGADGCRVHSGGEQIHVAGTPVRAVDTTGAGDCFAAAFVKAYLSGHSLHDSGEFACRIAALSVQALGSRAGVPTSLDMGTTTSIPLQSKTIERKYV